MRSGLSRACACAALALALPAAAGELRLVVQQLPLAGFHYGEAPLLWSELRVGDRLALVRDPENVHDRNAIRIERAGRLLGWVPRRDNAALAQALDRGLPLRARISRLAPHPNPRRRIEVEIYFD